MSLPEFKILEERTFWPYYCHICHAARLHRMLILVCPYCLQSKLTVGTSHGLIEIREKK